MADNGAFIKKNFIRDGKSKSDITSCAILAHILLEISGRKWDFVSLHSSKLFIVNGNDLCK